LEEKTETWQEMGRLFGQQAESGVLTRSSFNTAALWERVDWLLAFLPHPDPLPEGEGEFGSGL
jgi:hypothetical protein